MIKSFVTLMMLSYIDDVEQLTGLAAGRLFSEGGDGYMSIKKIAEKAGVSPATVSRVLNNPNYKCSVSGLRDKIWKTAIEMNYVPNEAARNLKKGVSAKQEKTWYINILMTRTDSSTTDPFFAELLRVIESEIHDKNCILSKVWYMSVFSDDRKCRRENLDRLIDGMYDEVEGKRDGLIIIGRCNKEALKKLNKKYKSVVSVNRNSTNYEVDEVLCDGKKIAAAAVEYLIFLGHKNIGYIGQCHSEDRYNGYLETLKKHDLDVIPEYVIETKQTEAEGYEAMEKFFQSDDMPTGIYCANDISAIGMLKCLNKFRNRYYMPSIISSDDIQEAQFTRPMLTTVSLPKEDMGKFALYLLLDRLKGGHSGIVRMELEGRLMIRNSCSSVEDSMWSDYCI
ncbi:LacI family DNA-binding transcriptional regulator [Blautia massiliensis (ex Durand et al. 2017)]|uniref:LacI family DNA-binding transcriptional regulator n=1 Tax=Blautia massiliensis (ex Durand et al. 2017) TaxID=1737424 RepID=UPI00242FF3FD|nr:LacI family DNA-binding transcriptional regulator [Blautia massiliensis (ex Durand et al. 2017)]